MPADAEEIFAYLKNTKSLRDQVTVDKGNPDAALCARQLRLIEATYRWPFQLHGMMGPSCAVADVGKDRSHDLYRDARFFRYTQGRRRAAGIP